MQIWYTWPNVHDGELVIFGVDVATVIIVDDVSNLGAASAKNVWNDNSRQKSLALDKIDILKL